MVRITNKMMVNDMNLYINNNLKRMSSLLEQQATTKKLNRPSDNPADSVKALRLRTNITETDQYVRNMKEGLGFLETTDSTLDEITQVMQRIREQIVYAGTDTNSPLERDAICKEISQLREHMMTVANTTHGSKYIFAGTNVTQRPCIDANSKWTGNSNELLLEIGVGVTFPMNIEMKDFFGNPDGLDSGGNPDGGIYDFLLQLEKNLTDTIPGSDPPRTLDADLIRGCLDEMDAKMNQLLTKRATLGAKVNRLELQMNRMLDTNLNYEGLLAEVEDADMSELITQINMQESIYKASLAIGARIIQPTLIDFLN